jgi:MraZ protein
MFFGEFEYRIDEKGRMPLPPRFRPYLKDGLMLTQGLEKCLTIYTMAEWKKLAESIAASHLPASKMRALGRAMFASAYQLTLDGQGRINLPCNLREYACISEDVVVAGLNNYLEVWDKGQWEAARSAGQEQAWQIIESLEKH